MDALAYLHYVRENYTPYDGCLSPLTNRQLTSLRSRLAKWHYSNLMAFGYDVNAAEVAFGINDVDAEMARRGQVNQSPTRLVYWG